MSGNGTSSDDATQQILDAILKMKQDGDQRIQSEQSVIQQMIQKQALETSAYQKMNAAQYKQDLAQMSSRQEALQQAGSEQRGIDALRHLTLEAQKQLGLDDVTQPKRRKEILENYLSKTFGKNMSFYSNIFTSTFYRFYGEKDSGDENRKALMEEIMAYTNNLYQVVEVMSVTPVKYITHPLAVQAIDAPLGKDFHIKFAKLTVHVGLTQLAEALQAYVKTLARYERDLALMDKSLKIEKNYTFRPRYQHNMPISRSRKITLSERALRHLIPILQRNNCLRRAQMISMVQAIHIGGKAKKGLVQPQLSQVLAYGQYALSSWNFLKRGAYDSWNYVMNSFRRPAAPSAMEIGKSIAKRKHNLSLYRTWLDDFFFQKTK